VAGGAGTATLRISAVITLIVQPFFKTVLALLGEPSLAAFVFD
jgi:hypothetical protein